MPKNVPFYRPFIDHAVVKSVNDVLEFDAMSNVDLLEEEFASFIGASYAVATSSGSSAMHLAMCALDLKRGDKVLCSINTFVDIPESVRHFDAEPIFVESNSDDYMMSVAKLKEALSKHKSKKLRAVVVTHMGGRVADIEAIYALAKEYNIKVIEDATDSMGSQIGGKYVGATGADMVVFSFAPHLVRDIVSGGILVMDDEELYQRAKIYRNHGLSEATLEGLPDIGYLYDMVEIGWSYEMSELSAAVCLERLRRLPQAIKRRKEIAKMYHESLVDVEHVKMITPLDGDNIAHFFVEIDKNRDHFARELKKEGIDVRLHYIPLNFMDYYKKKYNLKVFDFSTALSVYQKTLSLPLFDGMIDSEVQKVCTAVQQVAKSYM